MRLASLVAAAAVASCTALATAQTSAPAAEVFSIPKIAALKIDGDKADWLEAGKERGFGVDFLGELSPIPAGAPAEAPSLRLAWTGTGLAVLNAYAPVTTAAKPGRYFAVVNIYSPYGIEADRVFTLYRFPEKIGDPDSLELLFKEVTLPKEFGIPADVVARQSGVLADSFKYTLWDESERSDDFAVLLAGLAQTPTDAPPFVQRNNPWSLNSIAVHDLKKKLGIRE
jgi:hypothetical protein